MRPIVFVTGITSPILSKLVHELKNEFQFIGISRHPEKFRIEGVEISYGDILDPNTYSDMLENCSMVIHGAAITHTKHGKVYDQINYHATQRLVDLALQKGVDRFVFISSNTAGTESGAYGESKLKAENYIRENFDNWTIFRPSEIFGLAKGEGIEKLIQDALHKSKLLCPTGIPTPLYPIHINDVVSSMAETIRSKNRNGILRIHGPKGYSYKEIIQLVHNVSGRHSRIIPIGRNWMYFIKNILQVLPFQVSIVPDQVDRLYSAKETAVPSNTSVSLEDYVREQMAVLKSSKASSNMQQK